HLRTCCGFGASPYPVAPGGSRSSISNVPLDPDEVATKPDLRLLGSELRGEMAQLRGELRTEMAELRTGLSFTAATLAQQGPALRAGEPAQVLGSIDRPSRSLE